MLHLLKPSSSHKIPFLRPLLLLHLHHFPYSTTSTSSTSSSSQSSTSYLPFLSEPTSTEIADSVKEWFKSSSSPSSSSPSSSSSSQSTLLLDQIYFHLAHSADGPTLDSSLSSLKNLRLSERLVLQFLSHRPHHSAVPENSNLLYLRLKFFDWSGRQKIGNAATYRHTRSAFHALFRLLSRSRLASIVLDWLRDFRSSRSSPFPSPFISADPASNYPRLHDTLVVGYAVAGRPELALQLLARMRFCGLDLDYFSYHVLLNSLVEAGCFDYAEPTPTVSE